MYNKKIIILLLIPCLKKKADIQDLFPLLFENIVTYLWLVDPFLSKTRSIQVFISFLTNETNAKPVFQSSKSRKVKSVA